MTKEQLLVCDTEHYLMNSYKFISNYRHNSTKFENFICHMTSEIIEIWNRICMHVFICLFAISALY